MHIIKSSLYKTGYQVSLVFQITQDIQDKELIEILEKYLGSFGGRYRKETENSGSFKVESVKYILTKVIPFLDKYPLKGTKAEDYSD